MRNNLFLTNMCSYAEANTCEWIELRFFPISFRRSKYVLNRNQNQKAVISYDLIQHMNKYKSWLRVKLATIDSKRRRGNFSKFPICSLYKRRQKHSKILTVRCAFLCHPRKISVSLIPDLHWQFLTAHKRLSQSSEQESIKPSPVNMRVVEFILTTSSVRGKFYNLKKKRTNSQIFLRYAGRKNNQRNLGGYNV